MIISASRRTDIPAFYTEWFMRRIRAGFCSVPNPFNPQQCTTISLLPQDVDVIVFWTRNPRPLFPYLTELDQRGYSYYFQYTLLDYPRFFETQTPPLDYSLATFQELADRIGAKKVIWRYDPIIFSNLTEAPFHMQAFQLICRTLKKSTHRVIISIADYYRKSEKRLAQLENCNVFLYREESNLIEKIHELLPSLVAISKENDMEIFSCAEDFNLFSYGVRPGKCVDNEYIQQTFGISTPANKDPNQRPTCGCTVSKDIGVYDTCLFGCIYCYATKSLETAHKNHAQHSCDSTSLL